MERLRIYSVYLFTRTPKNLEQPTSHTQMNTIIQGCKHQKMSSKLFKHHCEA